MSTGVGNIPLDDSSHDFSTPTATTTTVVVPTYQQDASPTVITMSDDGSVMPERSRAYRCGSRCKACVLHDEMTVSKGRCCGPCPSCSLCCTSEFCGYTFAYAGMGSGMITTFMLCCSLCDRRSSCLRIASCWARFNVVEMAGIVTGFIFGAAVACFACAGTIYCLNKNGGACARRCGCPNFANGFDKTD